LADLKATCSSVDGQITKPFEHIIINGSSTSEIKQWLDEHPGPSYRKVINEKDEGISDAFNKGIEKSQGDLIHILNSGDLYYNEKIVSLILKIFNDNNNLSWVSGNIKIKRAGIWVLIGVPFDKKQLYKGMRAISHPTWVLKKDVYNKIGLYSKVYKIGMDYDLLCRLKNETYAYINEPLVHFDDNGISTNDYKKSLKENILIFESNFGYSLKSRVWQLRLFFFDLILKTNFGKWLYKIKSSSI
jgi:glycosyltransferase involved in cell wall biosynthesis